MSRWAAWRHADLDWGSHNPPQDLEAWQSLPAGPVRPGGMGCADQAQELGAPRAQALARGGQEAAAPQRARDRACQQAGPHRLERSCSWPELRGEENRGSRPMSNAMM